jgi:hypothetical protein
MAKIRQNFNDEHIEDIEKELNNELIRSSFKIKRGANIAIAVGSRGVANIDKIVKTTVNYIKQLGGSPFIIPAMGSHGGATPAGQREILEEYGVTEEYINAPIKSSMEVLELPNDTLKNKVFMDKYAFESDGVIVINRIKAHTDFHGDIESGLMKMCVIGLGKHRQALEIHKYGVNGLKNLIVPTARKVLDTGKVVLGIGLVENSYDKTAIIRAIKPEDIESSEKELLKISKKLMPSLPIKNIDLLIVDEMGKDISGVGMDPNIIGRTMIRCEQEPSYPVVNNIYVRDLTAGTHGNAIGVGLSDYISRKLFNKINFDSTYQNVITSTFLQRGFIPIIVETDKQGIQFALRTSGSVEIENARVAWIKNTLHVNEIYISENLLNEIDSKDYIEVITRDIDLIDKNGKMTSF